MANSQNNSPASVRQRLLNLAREKGQVFDVVLVTYGLERLMYRLSLSGHRDSFVLKGGMLVTIWIGDEHRVTRDADFLFSAGDRNSNNRTCRIPAKDTTVGYLCGFDRPGGIVSRRRDRSRLDQPGSDLRATAPMIQACLCGQKSISPETRLDVAHRAITQLSMVSFAKY